MLCREIEVRRTHECRNEPCMIANKHQTNDIACCVFYVDLGNGVSLNVAGESINRRKIISVVLHTDIQIAKMM